MWRSAQSLAPALLALGLAACSGGHASRTTRSLTPISQAVVRTATPSPTRSLPATASSTLPSASAFLTPSPAGMFQPTPLATSQLPAVSPPPPPTAPAAGAGAAPPPPPSSSLPSVATTGVTYPAGWNLIAGPEGTIVMGNVGPLYTLRAGDSGYEVVPSGTPLRAGAGYWAYLPQPTTVTLPIAVLPPITVSLVQNGSVMIGNPGNTPLTFVGGQQVFYSYDPRSGYHETTAILPGQGLWVYSFTAGSLSLGGQAP